MIKLSKRYKAIKKDVNNQEKRIKVLESAL